MNIPPTWVGDVQQALPGGAPQPATPGIAAGTLQDEFAKTFGATLRKSGEKQTAEPQKGDAKDVEVGKLAAEDVTRAAQPAPGTILDSAIASLKTEAVSARPTSEITSAPGVAPASLSRSASETLHNIGAGNQPYLRTAKVSKTGGIVFEGSVAESQVPKKTSVRLETSTALLAPSLKGSLASKGLSSGVESIDSLGAATIQAKVNNTDTSPTTENDAVAPALPIHRAATSAPKEELATGAAIAVAVAGIQPAYPVGATTLNAIAPKLRGARIAVKSDLENVVSGQFTAAKPNFAEIAAASSNGIAVQAASAEVALPATLGVPAAVLNLSGIRSLDGNSAWKAKGSASLDPDPTRGDDTAANGPSGTVRATSTSSDRPTAANTNSETWTAIDPSLQSGSLRLQDKFATAVQAASVGPLPIQTANGGAVAVVTKPLKTSPLSSNLRPVEAPRGTDALRQSTFDLSLSLGTKTLKEEAGQPNPQNVGSQDSSEVKAATPDPPRLEGSTGARAAAVASNPAKGNIGGYFVQDPVEHGKPSSENPAKLSSASVEISNGIAAAATLPVAGANSHTSDRAAVTSPTVAKDAWFGLQVPVQSTAPIAAPHLAAARSAAGDLLAGLSATEAGRISGAQSTEPYRTIAATPTTLEVGVPNGTQGWLRIRAEVGDQGNVNASIAAGSNSAQEMLHRQLPALNAYLHSEQIAVTTSVADRAFAAVGSSPAGMAPGSGGTGSSDTSGQSMHQDTAGDRNSAAAQNATLMSAGHQGGAAPGQGGQRDLGSTLQAVHPNQAARSYDSGIGVVEAAAAHGIRDSESGRRLNVRA